MQIPPSLGLLAGRMGGFEYRPLSFKGGFGFTETIYEHKTR
jgi:hypothetical protein